MGRPQRRIWILASAVLITLGCSDEGSPDVDATMMGGATPMGGTAEDAAADVGAGTGASGAGASTDNGVAVAPNAGSDSPAPMDASDPDLEDGQPVFFRVNKFRLTAPTLVLRALGLETPILQEVQNMLDMNLIADETPEDGIVDLNLLIRFSETSMPMEQAGKTTFGGALCPYPLEMEPACSADSNAPFREAVDYSNAMSCSLADTDKSLSGECFQSDAGRLALNLPLFGAVPLDAAQVIGTWTDGAEGGISAGWVRGFVSAETAKATTIQGEVPSHLALFEIQSGSTLEIFLPEEQETGPDGASGWWFLAEFSAQPARFEAGD